MGRGASQEFDHTEEPPALTMTEEISGDPTVQAACLQEIVDLDLREAWDSDSDSDSDD